jgi:hypothetical protein
MERDYFFESELDNGYQTKNERGMPFNARSNACCIPAQTCSRYGRDLISNRVYCFRAPRVGKAAAIGRKGAPGIVVVAAYSSSLPGFKEGRAGGERERRKLRLGG